MKVIKITKAVQDRGFNIVKNMTHINTVVFHNGNFYGGMTSIGDEIFSSSMKHEITNMNDLEFVTNEDKRVMFESWTVT